VEAGQDVVHWLLTQRSPSRHFLPQAPQLSISLAKFLQTPEQSLGRSVVHLHSPLWQVLPPSHLVPQAPQLLESMETLTQDPEQSLGVEAGQEVTQRPWAQRSPSLHLVPHPPQLSISFM